MRLLVCVMAVMMAAACAARGPVRQLEPSRSLGDGSAPTPETVQQPPADPITKPAVKPVPFSVRTRPPSSTVQTVEAADPGLAAALLKLSLHATAADHRAVADEYMRLGIFDKADEYLTAALEMVPHDAAAWEGKARIWRDWGWPHLALPHAIRAVHFAPSSHVARNTLGTVLQALGHHREARAQYEEALRLNIVLSDLCHSMAGDAEVSGRGPGCDLAYTTGDSVDGRSPGLAASVPAPNRSRAVGQPKP